ncbi:MAG: hypothetical protein ACREBS_11225 [Nitrososphaerales archaeon]
MMHVKTALSTTATISLIIVIIGAGLLGGYLSLGLGASTTSSLSINETTIQLTTFATGSSTDYAGSASSTEMTNSASGLQLQLSMNSTVLSSGQTVAINITEYNTLSRGNNISTASDWRINGLSLANPCGTYLPMGIEMFDAYFSTTNISSALANQTVQLYEPNEHVCRVMPVTSYYAFFPRSSNAIWSPPCDGNPYQAECSDPMTDTIEFNGTWTQGSGGEQILADLSPGTYTVVGGDEWGNIVLLYFQVDETVGLKSSSSSVDTPTECAISAEPAGFYLHAISDNTSLPVESASLAVTPVDNCMGSGPYTVLANQESNYVTNSSGWVRVPVPEIGGDYYLIFTVNYEGTINGNTYSVTKDFNVTWRPEQITVVTISLPSGNLAAKYCDTNNGTQRCLG